MDGFHGRSLARSLGYLILPVLLAGCHTAPVAPGAAAVVPEMVMDGTPRELCKTVLPPYVIEPPDILTIETVHAVPKPPYYLQTLDVLSIRVLGALPEAPVMGVYPVEPGGMVNLGVPYGAVRVAGMTVEKAREEIDKHLRMFLTEPQVAVALAELGASQRISGQFLVESDGSVTLGSYGNVHVVGLTLPEAKRAIEQHLSQFLERPVVSMNVYAHNSKVYYVILQGAGLGDGVYRFPVTGNDTVLDAIANINGLEEVSSKRIWIARPSLQPSQCQILPVDWAAVTEMGAAGTNYQIMPGDRVFIAEDKLVAIDTQLAKLFAPIERIMGFSLLGVATATRFSGPVLQGGGDPIGGRF